MIKKIILILGIFNVWTLNVYSIGLIGEVYLTEDSGGYLVSSEWYPAELNPEKCNMGIEKGAGQNGTNAGTLKSINKKLKDGELICKIVPLINS